MFSTGSNVNPGDRDVLPTKVSWHSLTDSHDHSNLTLKETIEDTIFPGLDNSDQEERYENEVLLENLDTPVLWDTEERETRVRRNFIR